MPNLRQCSLADPVNRATLRKLVVYSIFMIVFPLSVFFVIRDHFEGAGENHQTNHATLRKSNCKFQSKKTLNLINLYIRHPNLNTRNPAVVIAYDPFCVAGVDMGNYIFSLTLP